jgi:hypothetical protein
MKMANAFEEIDWIAAESLTIMTDALVISPLTAMDKTSDWNSTPDGYKKGDQVRIKTGPDYEAKEFTTAIVVQDTRSSNRNMVIEKHFDISVELTAKEMALNFEGFQKEVIAPAARRLAEKIDQYVGTKVLNGAGLYHSTTLLESAADVAQARKRANYQQLDPDSRFVLMDDTLEATLLGQTWFNQSQTRGGAGEQTLNSGLMGHAMGMDFFATQNFDDTGAGTYGDGVSTATVNGAGANNKIGDSVLTLTSSTGTFEVGDHIIVAGMKRPLVCATQAVATATTVALRDPITEIVPDAAAVSVQGSGLAYAKRGAIFDGKSMAVAFPVLDLPGDKVASVVNADGVSIRVVRGYDMTSKKTIMSLDVLCGAEAYDPRKITLLSNDT